MALTKFDAKNLLNDQLLSFHFVLNIDFYRKQPYIGLDGENI